jgi:hypothetical protein
MALGRKNGIPAKGLIRMVDGRSVWEYGWKSKKDRRDHHPYYDNTQKTRSFHNNLLNSLIKQKNAAKRKSDHSLPKPPLLAMSESSSWVHPETFEKYPLLPNLGDRLKF